MQTIDFSPIPTVVILWIDGILLLGFLYLLIYFVWWDKLKEVFRKC